MFLASNRLDGLKDFLPKPYDKLKLAFIPTAADPYADKWFVEKDWNFFKKIGLELQEINIADKTEAQLSELLKNVDIIYVSGGNTFYLLEKIHQSGFDKILKSKINDIYYIGSSAGAIIVGPDINFASSIDDPSKAPNLKSTKALNLIDFMPLPHYQSEKYHQKTQNILDTFGHQLHFEPIRDDQAIIINGNKKEIITMT